VRSEAAWPACSRSSEEVISLGVGTYLFPLVVPQHRGTDPGGRDDRGPDNRTEGPDL
jgi:hypothetical protein